MVSTAMEATEQTFFLINMHTQDDSGWIKIHRKILDNPLANNPFAFRVWMECLLRANHKTTKIMHGSKEITLSEGEFVFGREAWSKRLGFSSKTVNKWILRIRQSFMISEVVVVTGLPTIYRVQNWSKYQEPVTGGGDRGGYRGGYTLKNERMKEDIQKVYDHYIKTAQSRERLSEQRSKKIAKRLTEFTLDQLNQAVTNCFAHDFYSGKNERKWRANLDFVFRNYETTEKLLNLSVNSTRKRGFAL